MAAPNLLTSSPNDATIDLSTIALPVSFWQRPFVQNVMPLCTSMLLHAAVIIIGIATYRVVTRITIPMVDQITIGVVEVTAVERGGTLHPGPLNDASSQFLQPDFPEDRKSVV